MFNNISVNFDKPSFPKKYYIFSIVSLIEKFSKIKEGKLKPRPFIDKNFKNSINKFLKISETAKKIFLQVAKILKNINNNVPGSSVKNS